MTCVAAFTGTFSNGPVGEAIRVRSAMEAEQAFGAPAGDGFAADAVAQFFVNGGREAWIVRSPEPDALAPLEQVALDVLCLPDLARAPAGAQPAAIAAAHAFCRERRAFLVVDPPAAFAVGDAWASAVLQPEHVGAAAYHPWVSVGGRPVPPSGTVAGIIARTEDTRGVWKAPAGIDARLEGVDGLAGPPLTDAETEVLAAAGINVLRTFAGPEPVIWGARTLASASTQDPERRYVPVRRLTDRIERDLVAAAAGPAPVAEAERLLADLFRAGAFAGATPGEAFWVRGDAERLDVGFAPLRPGEFVRLRVTIGSH